MRTYILTMAGTKVIHHDMGSFLPSVQVPRWHVYTNTHIWYERVICVSVALSIVR